MPTTFTSSKVASTVQARAGLDITAVFASYELTAALVLNDVIEMVKVPAGATILDVILTSDDLDTAGPSIVLDVGDGDNRARFIDGTTVGGTGGTARLGSGITNGSCINYTYTAADTIDILVQVAPATGATSGTIGLVVLYTMNS